MYIIDAAYIPSTKREVPITITAKVNRARLKGKFSSGLEGALAS